MPEGFAGDDFAEFAGAVALTLAVDLRVEPFFEAGEAAEAEVGVEAGEVFAGGGHELGGEEVAERIGRKIAEAAHAPVDVLQAALGVVRRGQIEEGLELFAPGGGDIARGEVAGHEGLFEFEAEDDVEVVRRFVGFDANEGAFDIVEGEDPVVERDVVDDAGKHLLRAVEEVFPERAAATDLVFPEAGLRFVNTERAGLAEGRAEVGGVEALFVDAVAGFVEDAEKALVEFAEGVTRGQSTIAGAHAAAEGMRRDIEPTGGEIEADGGGGALAEEMLAVEDEFARQQILSRFFRRSDDRAHERDEFGPEVGEDLRNQFCGHAGFVFVEQGIVRRFFEADGLSFFAFERDDLFEPGGERGKIVLGAGFLPNVLRSRRRAGDLFDEAGGHLHSAIVRAANLTDVDRLIGVELRFLQFAEKFAKAWRRQLFVRYLCEERHLIGAKRGALGRHVRAFVPTEDAGGGIEEAFVAVQGDERFVRGHALSYKTSDGGLVA